MKSAITRKTLSEQLFLKQNGANYNNDFLDISGRNHSLAPERQHIKGGIEFRLAVVQDDQRVHCFKPCFVPV